MSAGLFRRSARSLLLMGFAFAAMACGGAQRGTTEPPGSALPGMQSPGDPAPGDGSGATDGSSGGDGASDDSSDGSGQVDGEGSGAVEPPGVVVEVEPPPPPPTREEMWGWIRNECPDPVVGSLASAWVYEPTEEERALAALDLEGSGTTFDLLADYEGTSIIIRVRDAATHDSVAVIKTTSSNTMAEGEIYAYRLARFLGFAELVPITVPVHLSGGALEKVRDLLASVTYDDEYKETNRRRVVARIEEAIASGETFFGAMKPWIRAFIFDDALGEREQLAQHPAMAHLRANAPQPDDEAVTLTQFTRLYRPQGTHHGVIAMWQLSEDLSNLLLMDGLMGQNDRFAGANVHFRAETWSETEIGERRGLPEFDMGRVRVLALDNGASMRGDNGTGFTDLRGGIQSGTRVERFEAETLRGLDALGRRAMGAGCDSGAFGDEEEAMWRYFGLEGQLAERARGYLENVVGYVGDLRESWGDAIVIQVPDAGPVSLLSM